MDASFIQDLMGCGVLKDKYVRQAFERIDRKDFVLPEYRGESYGDYPLSIGYNQTISQPYTVAFMLDLLQPRPGEKILDIGSGSGWTTALLAYIVSQKGNPKRQFPISKQSQNAETDEQEGTVVAIEIVSELCEFGKVNCEKYSFVSQGITNFFCQDGNLGLPQYAPYDKILASAAVRNDDIPLAWKEQLKVGGRIVTPVVDSVWVFDKIDARQWRQTEYPGFAFVPLIKN